MFKWQSILQCISIFHNGLEYKNADKEIEAWEKTVNKMCFHLYNSLTDHIFSIT